MTKITKIIIHCAATPNGVPLARYGRTPVERIDEWHYRRGFRRTDVARKKFNPYVKSCGYQFVIDTDGKLYTGRAVGETGAHTKGHNTGSVGICLVGTDKYTNEQWCTLKRLVLELQVQYGVKHIFGHRCFANKICPGFDVNEWLGGGCKPVSGCLVHGG
ncbi:MAG: N-acetylmuramoyl-L-alanine amidase [Gammaproteobacteria bacterium]|nr:N-acetylmuramoyl-L-alanine amidase [Gammaproteobacteria bacterium]